MAKISISLERNNLGKAARIQQIDVMLDTLDKDRDCLEENFKHLCDLPGGYSAWLDMWWGMVALVDKDRAAQGGISYESIGHYISTQSIKLRPQAQGKGLMGALLEHIIRDHGGLYSSSSISPGAGLIFKKLADKYGGYIVWTHAGALSYAPISSWKPRGIYKVFPFIKAPDGKEYAVDELEESIGQHGSTKAQRLSPSWKYGEIFIGKNGRPPSGFKPLSIV